MSKHKRRNRPGRMMSREMRQADRAAVQAHEAAIGPAAVARLADEAGIRAFGIDPASAVDLAQAYLDDLADPGFGLARAVVKRQYRRVIGRDLNALSAHAEIDAAEDLRDAAAEIAYFNAHPETY